MFKKDYWNFSNPLRYNNSKVEMRIQCLLSSLGCHLSDIPEDIERVQETMQIREGSTEEETPGQVGKCLIHHLPTKQKLYSKLRAVKIEIDAVASTV
ncbi:hypothetical protein NC652_012378 [Populus alba x Populus x berolinensis]|nr:hypothetical protein NC652_012378 [Populus alba x Populus x berolinensis]